MAGDPVSELSYVINHSILITVFVFTMMMIIDYLNVFTKGRMERRVKRSRARQYATSSFLGSTPGCLGAFMNVNLYVHGLIGFGAIVGGMIATSGDEAFVMLALFPRTAILLFLLLFILGIVGAWISDKIAQRLGFIACRECDLQTVHTEKSCRCFDPSVIRHPSRFSSLRFSVSAIILIIIAATIAGDFGPKEWNWLKATIISLLLISAFIILTVPDHYLEGHIWQHIIKKHIWRVFLWTFFALLFITIGMSHWDIESFVETNMLWVFLICALVGLIPESGPHMIFVMMFANGLVPFSILLTSSIVQDGHGMLPLFSYSVKDALMVKIFNLGFAIAIGLPLFFLGV